MSEESSIIDFSDDISEAEAPEPLPVGSYPARILAAEVKISGKGTKYAATTFYINVDDYPADFPVENAPDGCTIIFRRVGMEDNAQSRFGLKRFLSAIGAPMASRIDCNDWLDLEATVEVDHDEWQGVNRAQITNVSEA